MTKKKLIPVQILKSDKFQNLLPVSSKILFIGMLVYSDYAGFIHNPVFVIDELGASFDDFNLLVGMGFLQVDDCGVYVASEEDYFHE